MYSSKEIYLTWLDYLVQTGGMSPEEATAHMVKNQIKLDKEKFPWVCDVSKSIDANRTEH